MRRELRSEPHATVTEGSSAEKYRLGSGLLCVYRGGHEVDAELAEGAVQAEQVGDEDEQTNYLHRYCSGNALHYHGGFGLTVV